MTPNPGSEEAGKLGCTCPVLDNGHGKGVLINGKREFWFNANCPLHNPPIIPGYNLQADAIPDEEDQPPITANFKVKKDKRVGY